MARVARWASEVKFAAVPICKLVSPSLFPRPFLKKETSGFSDFRHEQMLLFCHAGLDPASS